MSRPSVPALRARQFGLRIARGWLGALVTAWGVQAVILQSLVLREAMVVMFGSELAWGVVLFAWLAGVAAGGAVGGWWSRRSGRPVAGLVVVLLVLGGLSLAELVAFRELRSWLGVRPGELVPVAGLAVAALLAVAPAGALVGLAFPLACQAADTLSRALAGDGAPRAGLLGDIYALESAGSLVGGVLFSFVLLEHWPPLTIALAAAAFTAFASAGLLVAMQRAAWAYLVAGLAGGAAAVALLQGGALDAALNQRRWHNIAPGYTLQATAESRYQNLAVLERLGQHSLFGDGHLESDFPDPYSFAPLAHFALCEHPAPRRVLLIGGGAEGLLQEVLRHPVERVDYVEPDPRRLELVERYLAPEDEAALHDPRVHVHHTDARHFVKTQAGAFDVTLARLPEPLSARAARFYTAAFSAELRSALREPGLLVTTVAATPTSLTDTSAHYVASVRATLATHFAEVVVGWDTPALVLAATEPGFVTTDGELLAARYAERGLESPYFHPALLAGGLDWLAPERVAQRAAELDAVAGPVVSTDLHPRVYLDRLVLWQSRGDARTAGAISWLQRVPAWAAGLVLALLPAGVLALGWLRRTRAAAGPGWFARAGLVSAVATTGLVTMALSIVWLFAYQNLYGVVYQQIGLLVAVLMGGLVIGCRLASRRRVRDEPKSDCRWARRRLVVVEVLLIGLAAAPPVLLPVLAGWQTTPATLTAIELVLLALVGLTGVLGGATFALAGALQAGAGRSLAGTAGTLIAADHLGACLGALLTGILLVPVFGIATTAGLLAGVKVLSLVLLLVARRGTQSTSSADAALAGGTV